MSSTDRAGSLSRILLGASERGDALHLNAAMANRHGLVAGATGTGKTVTLQVLAEGFSRLGVPVFTADVKGDLAGLSQPAAPSAEVQQRLTAIGIPHYTPQGFPVAFWDLTAEDAEGRTRSGIPVRSTVSEMGPLLLSRLLDLNETQQSVLEVAFRVADDEGLLLLDAKDLRQLLQWIAENLSAIKLEYGLIAPASLGAIQRRLVALEESTALQFFGEPALQLEHLLQRDPSGLGVINVLDATELIRDARVYTTFLLWLLSELFEELDEVGDQPLPKLVFFFDEAHLLFNAAPKSLLEKIETMVRLIRSKGVGVYFVTQEPSDVPTSVLNQLGNRIQHALRAYTPAARKHLQATSDAFRENPDFDVREVITELKVGEALVSTLNEDGAPTVVQRLLICPPESRIGPISKAERETIIQRSPLRNRYEQTVNRESAYEVLASRKAAAVEAAAKSVNATPAKRAARTRQSAGEAFFKSMIRSIGSSLGRTIARGLLGSILKR